MSEPQSSPEPSERPILRNPIGWIVLVALFGYLMASATARSTQETAATKAARYVGELRAAVAAKEAAKNPLARVLASAESPDEPLRKLERETAPDRLKDEAAAIVWVTVRRQLGERVDAADLAPLAKSKENAIYAEAYSGEKRSPAQAKALVDRLEARDPVSRIAAAVVRREAGLPKRADPTVGSRALALAALLGLLALASLAAWFVTLGLLASGTLRLLGPATEVRSPAEADGLALRAAVLLTTFVGLQLVVGLSARALNLDGRAATALVFAGMIAAVPLVLGGKAGMASVGLSLQGLPRNVGLGLWAFLLELPVSMIVAVIGSQILKNLPQPTHPASVALMDSPDFWTILVTFFSGAIVAPYWEETMFRGLLFPALRRVAGGPVVAALVSSFLFASIHPQGPVLWAALATVALFSCVFAQNARSLVPSIVMHFAHNATLLTLTLLIGRS